MVKIFCSLLACLALCAGVSSSRADDKTAAADNDKLAPLERFAGEWQTHGKWASGEELRARGVYEWGLGKKILKAKTYVMDGDKEYQRYEGVLAWHPKKKSLFEISFSFNGDISEYIIESKDSDTLQIGWTPFHKDQPAKVRQTIKFKDQDSFLWTVELKSDDGWKQLIESTWHRKK